MNIHHYISDSTNQKKKLLAVLIDPDKYLEENTLKFFIGQCDYVGVDLLFVGGSLMVEGSIDDCIQQIKNNTKIPVVIFPGSPLQISKGADAILFLSLISGRNAELLIGHHVIAAPYLKKNNLEIIPTGYILIDCGNSTTASYISNTQPIPYNKPEIAACTAMAGEMLGLKQIYLDGGSGAQKPISAKCIQQVAHAIDVPLIVGGGITSFEHAWEAWEAGADVVVIGTAFEKNAELLLDFKNRKKQMA